MWPPSVDVFGNSTTPSLVLFPAADFCLFRKPDSDGFWIPTWMCVSRSASLLEGGKGGK